MARCAEARSVTATSSGQRKCCCVAWARGGPTNSHFSPYLAHRCAKPASIDRYMCPTVAKSCPRGTMSLAIMCGTARPNAASPSPSFRSMPSGRSRNMKCRSACSPNGSSAR